jgi:SAM-dependent methyltransferase
MTYDFCTLFDANYLARALVLYRSLAETGSDFRLRAFCMDDDSHSVLTRLDLPGLQPIALVELEAHDPELAAVKPSRTAVEYYWTATPAVCLYCLEREPELEAITYLDADLMFFADPQPIFDELGEDSVLITPHRFASRVEEQSERNGVYNVQFLTFRRTEDGLRALGWWRERCLEWCYARAEDGKFGDQKYLDDWPERFAGVHVLEHPGGGLAPWNVERHALEPRNGSVLVDGRPLVFYHFHKLRLFRPATGPAPLPLPYGVVRSRPPLAWTTGSSNPVSRVERRLIWQPYVCRVAAAVEEIRRVDPAIDGGIASLPAREIARAVVRRTLPATARRLLRKIASLGPDNIPAVRRRRHRDSWRSPEVAAQMSTLAASELRDPDRVAPYRTFLESVETLLSEFPVPQPAALLDVGCGTGHYSELLERAFPGRFTYRGCDYSAAMIEEARRLWPERDFFRCDPFSEPAALEGYDVLLASALIDVLPEYDRPLEVLLAASAPYVLVHRQRITPGRSRVEVSPGYSGQTTYRVLLNLDDLSRTAARLGRVVARSFHVERDLYSFLLAKE